jgi:hypothetical protein
MRNDEELERLVRSKRTIDDMILHAQIALEHDECFKAMNIDREALRYSDAVLMQLGQIGEACSASKLPDETCDEYEHIDWGQINGFRNIAYHQYDEVNYDIVWMIVDDLLEDLIKDLSEVSEDLLNRISQF